MLAPPKVGLIDEGLCPAFRHNNETRRLLNDDPEFLAGAELIAGAGVELAVITVLSIYIGICADIYTQTTHSQISEALPL